MIADAQRRVSENARAGARFRRASEGVVGRGRALGGEVAVEVDASGALVRCAFGRGVQRVSLSCLGAGVVEATRRHGRTRSPGCAGPLWRRSGRTTRSWPP